MPKDSTKRSVDWFLPGMLGVVALAWLFPDAGARGGLLHPELLNELAVALIFFLHGLSLSFPAFRSALSNYRLHFLAQGSTFLFFPLLGTVLYFATEAFLGAELRLGLFYLCALPSTVTSSVILTATAGGNVPGALFNAATSSVLGVLLTPSWLAVLLGSVGEPLPVSELVLDISLWLLLPLVLGQLARPALGKLISRHASAVGAVDRATLLLLVYTSFSDSVKAGVWSGQGLAKLALALAASALLLFGAMAFVAAVSRKIGLKEADRVAAIFCGSTKSLATGVPMATLTFGAHPALGVILLPILIYHPLQLVACGWLAGRWGARLVSAGKPVVPS